MMKKIIHSLLPIALSGDCSCNTELRVGEKEYCDYVYAIRPVTFGRACYVNNPDTSTCTDLKESKEPKNKGEKWSLNACGDNTIADCHDQDTYCDKCAQLRRGENYANCNMGGDRKQPIGGRCDDSDKCVEVTCEGDADCKEFTRRRIEGSLEYFCAKKSTENKKVCWGQKPAAPTTAAPTTAVPTTQGGPSGAAAPTSDVPVGAGDVPVGAGGVPVGAGNNIGLGGAGGVPVGAGGVPVGAECDPKGEPVCNHGICTNQRKCACVPGYAGPKCDKCLEGYQMDKECGECRKKCDGQSKCEEGHKCVDKMCFNREEATKREEEKLKVKLPLREKTPCEKGNCHTEVVVQVDGVEKKGPEIKLNGKLVGPPEITTEVVYKYQTVGEELTL